MPQKYTFTAQNQLIFKDCSESACISGAIKIQFHAAAFAKMGRLICQQPKEVAWHGLISRKTPHLYEVEDILVYPQLVSDNSADPDQIPYQDWLLHLEDDIFRKLRMRGHSHVNMDVFPSSKDYWYQSKMVSTMKKGMFYVFMIWNKSYHWHTEVYDATENLMYTGSEVDIDVLSADSQPLGLFTGSMNRTDIVKLCNTKQAIRFAAKARKLIKEARQ
jgi:hypothetical protein